MRRIALAVQQQLQVARQKRDVVRALCLSDKLGEIEVAVRSAQDRLKLLSALTEAQAERSRHEFVVMQVLNDRTRDLSREAGQCIGEDDGLDSDTDVVVTIDPGIPSESVAAVRPSLPPPIAPRVASGLE
jgi:hypothetical protein